MKTQYIPDGLSKAQWDALKKKEAEELKAKGNLGAMGTTRFKSRSFEAWHKAGGVHLFPVDPNTTPYEERPYMQRKDGDWEGTDLKKRKMQGVGQGQAGKRLFIDNIYDKAKADGKLDSPSILGGGKGLPWTNKATSEISSFNPEGKQGARGVAGKKLSDAEMAALKSKLVKPVVSKKSVAADTASAAPPKKLFGFF